MANEQMPSWKVSSMPVQHYQFDKEPSLIEMLADPIVQAIMACDGVTRAEIEDLISVARGRIGKQDIRGAQTEPQLAKLDWRRL